MGPEPEALFRAPIDAPLALYVGAHHILTAVNDVWRSMYVGPVPIGIPAREIFLGPAGRVFLEALEAARLTGEKRYTPCQEHEARVVIVPLIEAGRVAGLATGCRPVRNGRMLSPDLRVLDLPSRLQQAS